MSHDSSVAQHYEHGSLLEAIERALPAIGRDRSTVTVEDLGPVDEFHLGGREATDHLLARLELSPADHVLDVGCGLGGAARFAANARGCRVTGIDLTEEYVEAGQALSSWVGLGERIDLHRGSALHMPFADATFTAGFMLHVGMNIAAKEALFREIRRVLRPGSRFGVYDIMRGDDGPLTYPVPWAADESTSHLSTLEEYVETATAAGLEVEHEESRRAFALDFVAALRARASAGEGPPPLGLHTLMKSATPTRIGNMAQALTAGVIDPTELILRRP